MKASISTLVYPMVNLGVQKVVMERLRQLVFDCEGAGQEDKKKKKKGR